jgi:Spy/CpxP family protein refolding chaperone
VNTWKVILATIVIFAAGVLTGGLITRQLERANVVRRQHLTRPALPFSPGGSRLEFLRRAQRDLDLTPEQRERVDRILKDSQERSRKIMEPVAPQLRQEIQRAKEEFRGALTPEQQKRFDELLKRQPHPHDRQQSKAGVNTACFG